MKWYIKKFEELTIDELYNILKERVDVFVVEQKCPYPECDGKDKSSYHMYAKDENDEIIAYLRIPLSGISYEEISIGRVLVRKDHRGKGLGREMLIKAISFIESELGENVIRIEAQEYLIDFYKSLGFVQVSKVFLEDNIPHVKMVYSGL